MSSSPSTTPQVQASKTTSSGASTSSTSTSTPKANPFAVPPIPAFRGPVNYAAAASKSKPSPPAINGKDATATVIGTSGLGATSAAALAPVHAAAGGAGHARKQSVKVEGVQVPVARVGAIRAAAADLNNVAFGNVNDKNATLSSSPAAPPALKGNPQTFGTVPVAAPATGAPAAPKAPLNLHAFFTGGSSPSPAPATLPAERRSVATFDPSSRSPQPSPSTIPGGIGAALHHPSQLSSNSQSFAPRGNQPPPSFVPQQQQQSSFPSPSPQYAQHPHLGGPPPSSPYQQHQGQPYLQQQQQQQQQQHNKPSPQNIPNGNNQQPYGGPGGANVGGPQSQGRNGSFVGSPVMQQRQQPGTPQRGQFGPTSPRLPNVGLPQGGMMGYPHQQQWQQPQPYGQYPAYYNPGMQSYPPPAAYAQQQGPPSIPPITPSGSSTPSTGVRTPSVSAASGIPPPPSPAPSANSFAYSSPQPQSATLPHHPQHPAHHGYHASLGGTPLRAPGSPFSLSAAAHASEFKPNVEVPSFVPSPRRSAAIKIRNPKDVVVKDPLKEEKPVVEVAKVEPKVVEAKVEVKEDESVKVAEEAKKVVEEKSKKDEEERVVKEASEKKVVEEEKKVVDAKKAADEAAATAAAVTKVAEEKKTADAAAAAAKVADEKKKNEEIAAALALSTALAAAAAATPVVEEKKVEAAPVEQTKVEAPAAVEPVVAATPTPTNTLPSFLPSKPVNSAVVPDDKPKRAIPASLDLSSTKSADVSAPLPSALASARAIENLASISYPADIKSPRPDLNADAEPGKYRYDREFLMQFMTVCKEKPDGLPNLEAIGMVDSGADAGRGGFSGRGGPRSSMGPPAVPGRSASGAQFGSARSASTGGAFGGMGNFGQGQQPLGSSQARFEASLAGGGARPPAGSFQGRAGGSMSRQTSQSGTIGGASFAPAAGGRVPSRRGQPRESNQRGGSGGGGGGGGGKNGHVTGQGFEDAAPLEASETGWKPDILGRGTASGTATPTSDSPEMVVRKVKALLNKLTLEKFDSISDQILEWADKSINETDGRILRQVIALIFEKATDEANWSEMYARLCRKLMEKVSVNVKDETVKGPDGVPVAGGALFRKYLLNRCQEDYESGWKQKEVAAAAAAGKAADDNAKKEANDAAKKEEEEKTGASASASSSAQPKEAELLSDEYYAAQKAKRRGLGLVRFIGELYRLSMLTERIMHECIKKLLANTENPEEEDVESLCRLLTTVGKGLDNAKAKQHMDIYFTRMKMISDNMKISSRIRFMIQDVLELRSQRWQPRHDSAGPKLISEIHSDAQKASEEASRRTASSGGKGMPRLQDQLSRPGSRRGQGRDQFGVAAAGADGWSAPVPQRPAKAGDLSSFGKIREPTGASLSMGPSGAFANRAAKAKEAARPAAPSNPFAILSAGGDAAPERPKLVLAPRTKPVDGSAEEEEKPEEEEAAEEEEDDGAIDPNAISMSRAEGERKAGNSVKEFFAVKNISEGVESVKALPVEYRSFLIAALVDAAVNKKADDVNLTRQLFAAVIAKEVVSHAVMLKSLEPLMKMMIDYAVDVPGLYGFAANLAIGAGASREEVEGLSLKMESEEEEEEEVERGRKSLLTAFDKLQQ